MVVMDSRAIAADYGVVKEKFGEPVLFVDDWRVLVA
jgi:hypothetical protein